MLRSVDFGDADRVLTLLTRGHGKVGCVARNARRSKKRFGGVLQPLTLLRVSLEPRHAGLFVLHGAEIAWHPALVTTALDRLSAGYAALELLRELIPDHAPDEECFELANALLATLDRAHTAPASVLACFEARLLSLVGFAPMLELCGVCGKRARPGQRAFFDPEGGHLVCSACAGGAAPHLNALSGTARAALMQAAGGAFEAAADILQAPDVRAAQVAMRAMTEHRIGRALAASSLFAG